MKELDAKYHVKFYLKSGKDYLNIQRNISIEIHSSSLRKIDNKNFIVEAYVSGNLLEELKKNYQIQVLGNVNEIIAEACKYVSKKNRFKNH